MKASDTIHVGIDASNIRQGGGLTYLSRLLHAFVPDDDRLRVTVWAPQASLDRLPDRAWLQKCTSRLLEGNLLAWYWWQQAHLVRELREAGCDILFAAGGMIPHRLHLPAVAISMNLLPFEPDEARHFGEFSAMRLKCWLIRRGQIRAFRRSKAVIFLSEYARGVVSHFVTLDSAATALIPFGIEQRFFLPPRQPRRLEDCSPQAPFRLLYVSILMPYKHQPNVAHAAARLRARGLPIVVEFVGPEFHGNGETFEGLLRTLDQRGEFLRWRRELAFDELHLTYQSADGFLFASSCENLPNVLMEAMAAGLPIMSSDRGPMPDMLRDAAVLFDPLSIESIEAAMLHFCKDAEQRQRIAAASFAGAGRYSWERCASETFAFLRRASRRSPP